MINLWYKFSKPAPNNFKVILTMVFSLFLFCDLQNQVKVTQYQTPIELHVDNIGYKFGCPTLNNCKVIASFKKD